MAGIVHFINPDPGEEGHFDWHWQAEDDPETFENWLNVTKPSTEQSELATGNSVGQLWDPAFGSVTNDGASVRIVGGGSGLTKALAFGDPVGGGEYREFAIHWVSSGGGGLESDFPENQLRYIGVLTTGGNYGWIAVMRVPDEFGRFVDLRALAWAYQTEVGKSINAGEVPGVGGVALFGLAGLAARRRRREGAAA